ncbi:cupin domain [Haloactinospora alba]|uniref:Cupin domain n=1 Tax=Haloactinospora alba TaxID=405555 RepID=A0A543N8X3_9ACTN|nr:cupin domain-containing protein [Haloactinospora alba]TQN28286.1 cupin domain [Haloactinospora alba]
MGTSDRDGRDRAMYVAPGAGPSVWAFGGDRYTLKAGTGDTRGALGVMEAEIPPGNGPPLHIHHNEDEMFYLLDGTLEIVDADRAFTAEAGCFLLLPRGSAHRFTNVSDRPARILMLFSPSGFEEFFLEVGTEAVRGQAPAAEQSPAEIARSMRVAEERYGIESV